MPLPHRFPFRLVDHREGSVRLLPSAGSFWLRGVNELDLPLLVEATAQAAAELLAPADASGLPPQRLALAALSACELVRTPRVGEALSLEVAIEARLGEVVRVAGVVRGEGGEVARLHLTLSAAAG